MSAVADIMKESGERFADMQEKHVRANSEIAKSQAELSLKVISAVAASNAKIAVQPATLNCGSNGSTPSPRDVMAWIEDIKGRYNYGTTPSKMVFVLSWQVFYEILQAVPTT